MTTMTNSKQSTTPTNTKSTLLAGRDVKDFKFEAPMVDVRGWDVVTAEGTKVGSVDRIMLDAVEHKPRYLSVTPLDRSGHMLLPIGVGTLVQGSRQVRLDGIKPVTLTELPPLTSDVVTHEFESRLIGAVGGGGGQCGAPASVRGVT